MSLCYHLATPTRILAGPFCAMLLGDLGAEVIKIEQPGENTRCVETTSQHFLFSGVGDDTRRFGPPFMGEESVYFFSVNRNKKVQYQLFLRSILMNMPQSITVDFSTDKGKEIIKQVSQLHLFN